MQNLASSKPFTFPKYRYPGFIRPVGRIGSRARNIWQINVVFSRIPVLAKYRVDSFLKLDSIRFIDIVDIYPKVLQAITPRLLSAELYLAVASLTFTRAVCQILESDLLVALSVRKYNIFLGYIAFKELGQDKLAIVVVL